MKALRVSLFLIALAMLHVPVALSASDDVQVALLGSISLDEVGVLTQEQGGLSFDAYQGSDGALIETLLVALPHETQSDVARDLKNRLLASITKAPQKYSNLFSFWEVKFIHLAHGGQSEAINQMILQIPSNMVTQKMQRLYVASLFVGEQEDAACPLVTPLFAQYGGLAWREMLIYCQAWQGQTAAAQFSITLLEEDGHQLSDELEQIINAITAGDKNAAHTQWSALLSQQILSLPPLNNPFPSLGYLYNSPVSGRQLTQWWKDTQALSHAEKLEEVTRFYSLIEALDDEVSLDKWQEMLMFSVTHDVPLPDEALARLLADAAGAGRKAETVLIVLHMLGENAPQAVSVRKLTAIVDALQRAGFEKDARRLAFEGVVGRS